MVSNSKVFDSKLMIYTIRRSLEMRKTKTCCSSSQRRFLSHVTTHDDHETRVTSHKQLASSFDKENAVARIAPPAFSQIPKLALAEVIFLHLSTLASTRRVHVAADVELCLVELCVAREAIGERQVLGTLAKRLELV